MILMLSLKEREIPKRTSISCPHLLTCNSNNIQSNPRKSRIGKIIPDVSVWKVPAFVAITLSSGVAQFGHYVPQIHLVCCKVFPM